MISRGPKIPTNGLILHLDPANKKSYSGSGTTCTDLAQRRFNYTISNATYNLNSFSFNGSNAYISSNVIAAIPNSSSTFISWVKRSGNQNQYDGIMLFRSSTVGGIVFQTGNQLAYIWTSSPSMYEWLSGLVIPDLTWCMCAATISPLYTTLFLCQSSGITQAYNAVANPSNTINGLQIGRDTVPGRYFTGDIGQCMIYNRSLSKTEIEQVFNASRGRYGI